MRLGLAGVSDVRQGKRFEIEVDDNGQGISAEALPHIFDRFWQATDKDGGSGLGLAIVKSIVEAHGGKVWGESEPGEGTRFTVRLPRAA